MSSSLYPGWHVQITDPTDPSSSSQSEVPPAGETRASSFQRGIIKQWEPPSPVTSKRTDHLHCVSLNLSLSGAFPSQRGVWETADLGAPGCVLMSCQTQCAPPHFFPATWLIYTMPKRLWVFARHKNTSFQGLDAFGEFVCYNFFSLNVSTFHPKLKCTAFLVSAN